MQIVRVPTRQHELDHPVYCHLGTRYAYNIGNRSALRDVDNELWGSMICPRRKLLRITSGLCLFRGPLLVLSSPFISRPVSSVKSQKGTGCKGSSEAILLSVQSDRRETTTATAVLEDIRFLSDWNMCVR